MGAIAGAVGRVLAAGQRGAHLPPEELRRLVQVEVNGRVGSRDRAAASIAIQLNDVLTDAFVLTHSASATVREPSCTRSRERVVCTVSAPLEEGRAFSEELRASGLDVDFVEDADAIDALERSSVLLIGADTVFRDGSVANKVGTRPLAEAAARLGICTIVACEVIKLAPIDPPERIEDEHFDITPARFIDEVVTEEEALSDGVRSLVDRTPFLSEGYALLDSGGKSFSWNGGTTTAPSQRAGSRAPRGAAIDDVLDHLVDAATDVELVSDPREDHGAAVGEVLFRFERFVTDPVGRRLPRTRSPARAVSRKPPERARLRRFATDAQRCRNAAICAVVSCRTRCPTGRSRRAPSRARCTRLTT